MKISAFERAANYVILVLFAFVVFAPIGVILTLAFGPQNAAAERAGGAFHPENFADAWVIGRFGQYMVTSVVVAVIVVVLAVTASILAGYALGTMRFAGQGLVFLLFLLGIMVPTEAFVVPLFFDLRQLGLTNTVWGVALPQVAMSIAFGTYWMRTYFRSSSVALIEAARLDGAGSMRILWQILVPVGRPAILTLVLLVFMWTWNEFLIPLVMSPNATIRTAPLGLAFFQGQYTQGTALLAAGAVLVAAPVVVLYIFLQRHFIRGMLEGAVRE
ncbi:MAG: carbohydrate ABC transporter permease [Propionicimonas sp.]|uniref:carbohydrate ABC transporter permease n=1 Tax=Propionicimonas sp. TaxID=1955623 RepID=UPI002B1FAF81|nr:carbohydrate ABC transporter permease [Propionicimonas sp.]MEA4944236.1 carbohydrate ABC transporter permease [Propionicimonas sp.]MEA5055732.1 carbohydrate ABC transporter permease [Propionicimonas sp.]MEA5119509.1 carbohydrate ABC transporter permease [Propionicimonas sp.]